MESGDDELEHQADVRVAALLNGHRYRSTTTIPGISMKSHASQLFARSTETLSPTGC
jgi:hypothetical protein